MFLRAIALICCLMSAPTFADDTARQEIVVSRSHGGTLVVYARVPLRFLFGDTFGADGSVHRNPLLEARQTENGVRRFLSAYALEEEPKLFTERLLRAVRVDDRDGRLVRYRLIAEHPRYVFARPLDAEFDLQRQSAGAPLRLDVAHVAWEVAFDMPAATAFILSSELKRLPTGEATSVDLRDYRAEPTATAPVTPSLGAEWFVEFEFDALMPSIVH